MDCAPLNLAHFHERRANKFLRHHRYDDAYKAVETSLLYLQDAYKKVTIAKSIEVLNTQKWDYERKLRQIQMRKVQYERSKLREIVPITEPPAILKPPDANATPQAIAKSIHKTIEDFDAKFGKKLEQNLNRLQPTNEDEDCRQTVMPSNRQITENEVITTATTTITVPSAGAGATYGEGTTKGSTPLAAIKDEHQILNPTGMLVASKLEENTESVEESESESDIPALAPLELPAFDFSLFNNSAHTLAGFPGLTDSFQK